MGLLSFLSGNDDDNKSSLKIGDRVMVRYSGLEGTIIDQNSGTYMVGFSNGKPAESYDAEELKQIW